MGTPFGVIDEFEIKATGHATEPERTWTRATLDGARAVADEAVLRLGYLRAEVVNTFGGHRSAPIYIVDPEGGSITPEC